MVNLRKRESGMVLILLWMEYFYKRSEVFTELGLDYHKLLGVSATSN